jgi:hypothetical protein
MRALLAILCLFCGSPDDLSAEGYYATQEPKVERYRILLSELTSLPPALGPRAPMICQRD